MVRAQAEMGGKHASMHGVNAPWGCAASSRSRARAPVDMRCANPYSSAERGRKVALWCGSGSQCLGAEDVPPRARALAAALLRVSYLLAVEFAGQHDFTKHTPPKKQQTLLFSCTDRRHLLPKFAVLSDLLFCAKVPSVVRVRHGRWWTLPHSQVRAYRSGVHAGCAVLIAGQPRSLSARDAC